MNPIDPHQSFRNYFTHTECILAEKYVKSINLKQYPVSLTGKREKILVVPTKKYIPVVQIGPEVVIQNFDKTVAEKAPQLNSHIAEVTAKQPTLQTQIFEVEKKQDKESAIFLNASEKATKNSFTLKGSQKSESSDVEAESHAIEHVNSQFKMSGLHISIGALAVFLSIKWILK